MGQCCSGEERENQSPEVQRSGSLSPSKVENVRVVVYTSEACQKHGLDEHPENANRMQVCLKAIEEVESRSSGKIKIVSDAKNRRLSLSPGKTSVSFGVSDETLSAAILRTHSKGHVDHLSTVFGGLNGTENYKNMEDIEEGNDTVATSGTDQAVTASLQICLAAVDRVVRDDCRAFCLIRPPGHHATRNKAMGFCFYNNIAITAMHALDSYPETIKRVAILDFDAHHGNGTEELFHDSRQVLYCSTHQEGIYPGTGHPSVKGKYNNIINSQLKEGDGGEAFREAWTRDIFPRVAEFDPDLILVSAGFDAHRFDPLANLSVDISDYAWITSEIVGIANDCCSGRVVSLMEGGYNLEVLGKCVATHVDGLTVQ